MQGHNTKKFVSFWVAFCMMLSLFASLAITPQAFSSGLPEGSGYPTTDVGTLKFDGFTLHYNETSHSIQAFVDVYAKDADVTGVMFQLKYNSSVIEPSDAETNEILTVDDSAARAFAQNTAVFPITTDPPANCLNIYGDSIDSTGDTTTDKSYTIGLVPVDYEGDTSYSTYIGKRMWVNGAEEEQRVTILSGEGDPVKLGRLSFNVKDAAQLVAITDFTNYITPVEDMSIILYLDSTGNEWPSGSLATEWHVNRTLLNVIPKKESATISAYSLYGRCLDIDPSNIAGKGTKADLIAYLNQEMGDVVQVYTDNNQLIDRLFWDESLATVEVVSPSGASYDPKGNRVYKITQNYIHDDDSFPISVQVTVTPSVLTGFNYTRKNMTFSASSRPTTVAMLRLPDPITAIITGVDDSYILPQDTPETGEWQVGDWTPSGEPAEPFMTSTDFPVSETYTRVVPHGAGTSSDPSIFGTDGIPAWLTVENDDVWTVSAKRNVVADGVLPPTPAPGSTPITAEVERVSGALDIHISPEAFGAITEDPEHKFTMYIPGMDPITTDLDYVTIEYGSDPATDGVTVKIQPLPADGVSDEELALREKLQSIINLGNDDFTISFTPADGVEMSDLPFEFDPRVNYYLSEEGPDDHSRMYVERDYSSAAGKAQMFPVYEGQSLSEITTYIVFPDDSTIPVAYHGQTGYNDAELGKAKVIEWTLDDGSTVIPAAGTTVTLIGKLKTYYYSGFGNVSNDDNVYLKLKVTSLPPDGGGTTPSPSASPGTGGTTPSPSSSPGTGDATPSPSTSPSSSASPAPTEDPDDPEPPPTVTPTPIDGNGIKITTVVESGATVELYVTDSVENITFQYDTKQRGYSPNQLQTYTIENIGTTNLSQLDVNISDLEYIPEGDTAYTSGGPESFHVTNNKIYDDSGAVIIPHITTLDSGGSLKMDIRTAGSLPVGTYKARVSVMANPGEVGYFFVTFKVTRNPVYKVKVDNSDCYDTTVSPPLDIGVGYLRHDDETGATVICSNTYEVGETVYLHVDVHDSGYVFKEWQNNYPTDSISFASAPSANTSFTMVAPANLPDRDYLEVKPDFEETDDVWVRLVNLRDFNPDTVSPYDNENDLMSTAAGGGVIPFSETTYEYRTMVDSEVEQNYVTFVVKNKYRGTTPGLTIRTTLDGTEVTHTDNSASPADTPPVADTTEYKIPLFDLHDGANVVKIIVKLEKDGTTYQKVYKLTIYRKSAIGYDSLVPGNSPYGLIESADNIADADKAAAKTGFSKNHMFVRENDTTGAYEIHTSLVPDKAVTTYQTRYSPDAWKTKNYDEDITALFVYSGTTFVDPGFKDLKMSDGNLLDDPTTVSRKIEKVITIKDSATINTVSDLSKAENVEQNDISITNTGESVVISELADKKVRPGVYTMRYSFTDWDGSAASFTRPIIVLPKKGDLKLSDYTLSGNSLPNPEDIIYSRMDNGLYEDFITSDTDWARLYAYRAGDITEDFNVNSVDANAIKNKSSLPVIQDTYTIYTRQYYEPLPVSLAETDAMPTFDPSTVTAIQPVPVPTTTPKPVLTLDYLGTAQDPNTKATTPSLTASNVYNPSAPLSMAGIVWVGVGIKNVENLDYFLQGLYSVDIAIDYDPNIVQPCDRDKHCIGDSLTGGGTTDKSTLLDTLKLYNTDSNITTETSDVALWKSAKIYEDSYVPDLDLNPTPDPSASPLPSPTPDPTDVNVAQPYKTEFITILAEDLDLLRMKNITNITADGASYDTDTIYLLRVPFRINKFPGSEYDRKVIDLHLTEHTFVLGSTKNGIVNSASWEHDDDSGSKTTSVNNASNHFDKDITDIFDTGGTYAVKGKIKGWDPSDNEPFIISLFKQGNLTETPDYTYTSVDVDSDNRLINGSYESTADGEITWNFWLNVPNRFDYRMVISKKSHLTYPDIHLLRDEPEPSASPDPSGIYLNIADGEFTVSDLIELIVGDTDTDEYIKDPDRVEIIRYFNQQKPWLLYKSKFEAADLNGDGLVDLFDLNLWRQNQSKQYSAEEGGGEG